MLRRIRVEVALLLGALLVSPLAVWRWSAMAGADGTRYRTPVDLTRTGSTSFAMRQPVSKDVSFDVGWTTPRADWTLAMPGDGRSSATHARLGDLGCRLAIRVTDEAGQVAYRSRPEVHIQWSARFERHWQTSVPVEERGEVEAAVYVPGFLARSGRSYTVFVDVEKPIATPGARRGWITATPLARDSMQRFVHDLESFLWSTLLLGLCGSAVAVHLVGKRQSRR